MCALVRPLCATGCPQLARPLVLRPSGCTRLGPCAPRLACWSRLPPCAPNGPAALCAQWSCGLVRPMVLRPCAPNGPVALCARCHAPLCAHCNDGLFTHSSATLCPHSPTASVRPRLPHSLPCAPSLCAPCAPIRRSVPCAPPCAPRGVRSLCAHLGPLNPSAQARLFPRAATCVWRYVRVTCMYV